MEGLAVAEPIEIAPIIRDLLRIAKVAIPPKIYAEDPRVTRATALLKSIETGRSPSRTPNVASRPSTLDVMAMVLQRPVEESFVGISFVADLPWDVVEALAFSASSSSASPTRRC